nr:nucleoside-diphosphate sugar epimerase/dehydratase [Paenibacillus periandrae]
MFSLFFNKNIYKKVWQHASIEDVFSLVKLVFSGYLISFVVISVLNYSFSEFTVPRSIHVMSLIISMVCLCCSRILVVGIHNSFIKMQPHHQRALIVGAGQAGMLVVKQLKQTKYKSAYFPIAFVDDDRGKHHMEIYGVPIAGHTRDIPHIVSKFDISIIIIAVPSANKENFTRIIEICKQTTCQLKIMPAMSDLIQGHVNIGALRNVSVEDLLGREPIRLDSTEIKEHISNKTVMVTGAGGSIGSELCRQVCKFSPQKLILLGRGENSIYEIELELKKSFPHIQIEPIIADLQDRKRVDAVLKMFRPDVVFHAAAHKHVPLMEKNPVEAIKNNVFGTRNLVHCCHIYEVSRFVLVSTDKAVNPTNVMGATKRLAEMIVQNMNGRSKTKFVAVRFGNVLGSRGSVIPLFKKQIEAGGPVTVTHPEMVRFFMTIPEAVQLVIQAGAFANGGEIFILDMGKPVKIVDLARDLIALSGLEIDKDIAIQFTGIRPGEKLFEELLSTEEITSATKHNRIYIGRPAINSLEKLDEQLSELEQAVLHNDISLSSKELRMLLCRLVPSYQMNTGTHPQKVNNKFHKNLVYLEQSPGFKAKT